MESALKGADIVALTFTVNDWNQNQSAVQEPDNVKQLLYKAHEDNKFHVITKILFYFFNIKITVYNIFIFRCTLKIQCNKIDQIYKLLLNN